PPRFKNGFKGAAVEVRAQPVLEKAYDSGVGDRRVHRETGRRADLHDQRVGRIDPHHVARCRSTRSTPESEGKIILGARTAYPARAFSAVEGGHLAMISRRVFSTTLAAGAAVALMSQRGPVAIAATVKARNIVFVHGLFADGSCWLDVIARLQPMGFNLTSVQNP